MGPSEKTTKPITQGLIHKYPSMASRRCISRPKKTFLHVYLLRRESGRLARPGIMDERGRPDRIVRTVLRSRLIHDVLDRGSHLAHKRVGRLLVARPQRLRQLSEGHLGLLLAPVGRDAAVHGVVHDLLEDHAVVVTAGAPRCRRRPVDRRRCRQSRQAARRCPGCTEYCTHWNASFGFSVAVVTQ